MFALVSQAQKAPSTKPIQNQDWEGQKVELPPSGTCV
jgi:hypothetical protein